jgi:hypothetical protein
VNRFDPGQDVATPAALAALEALGESLPEHPARHFSDDWGETDAADTRENELSLTHGWRLLSVYTLKSGTKIRLVVAWLLREHSPIEKPGLPQWSDG